jgi:hypothetical protein
MREVVGSSGIVPSTVKIFAASTSSVCALLRLENATAPTVSFSRIIKPAIKEEHQLRAPNRQTSIGAFDRLSW